MSVPLSQMWTVATYVLRQKLRGVKRYPLVLMLEPLFRCNLACAGCGKIDYPAEILNQRLSVAECVTTVRNVYFLEEFGSPEAIWELEVKDFPVVVTMDAHGGSLHKEVMAASSAELARRL